MEPYRAAVILGATEAKDLVEVRAAYKRLAIKYHPDKSKEPDAESRFKEASEAFAVVSGYVNGGGSLPVPRSAVSSQPGPMPSGEEGWGSFVHMAVNIIPGLGPGLGGIGSVIFDLLANGTVSESGIESILETLFAEQDENARTEGPEPVVVTVPPPRVKVPPRKKAAPPPHGPRPKPVVGTLSVGPISFQRYLKASDNGRQEAPLFGKLGGNGRPPTDGTFQVQSLSDGVATIDGRRYHLQIEPPKVRQL